MARALMEQGVRKGDRVCMYLDNCPDYLVSYFALWRLGAVAVPANSSLREDELLHLITDSGARTLIHDEPGASVAAAAARQSMGACSPLHTGRIRAMPESDGVVPPVNCGLDDLLQLQYTAGNTGAPKGAMLTCGNLMASLETEREVLGLTENDRYLGIYPLGHVGVSWGLSVLRAGGTFVFMKRFSLPDYNALCAT